MEPTQTPFANTLPVLPTKEEVARVERALATWQDAQAEAANTAAHFFRDYKDDLRAALTSASPSERADYNEALDEVLKAIDTMNVTQERFLKAFHAPQQQPEQAPVQRATGVPGL